jgi:hypothetical protein
MNGIHIGSFPFSFFFFFFFPRSYVLFFLSIDCNKGTVDVHCCSQNALHKQCSYSSDNKRIRFSGGDYYYSYYFPIMVLNRL